MSVSVEKIDKLYTYEREWEEMSKKDKKGSKALSIMVEIAVAVVSSLVVSFVGAMVAINTTTKIHEEKIENVNKDLEEINGLLSNLSKSVEENGKILAAHTATLEYLSKPGQASGSSAKKVILNGNSSLLTFVNNENKLASPKWNDDEVVATDMETNEKYTGPQLRNEPLIIYYAEEENEVYFCGQYNKNDRWNGLCVLNVYKNNELITIFEGMYDDGKLCNYRRISCDEGESWAFADRTDCNTYTTGETWVYEKTGSYTQKINKENLDANDILKIDGFMNTFNERLVAYYNGRTSDGFYNDNTGNAFLVKYFGDNEIEGTEGKAVIHTLYKGRFQNGYFEDETDESWYITRDVDTTYMYYKGSFSNRTADNKKVETFENPAGKEYISQKLKENGFEEYESEFYIEYE